MNLNNAEAMRSTSLKLYDRARERIALRKAGPRDPASDITSALLGATHNGVPLPELVVGIVAPTIVLGSIAVHLSCKPALPARLRADPWSPNGRRSAAGR